MLVEVGLDGDGNPQVLPSCTASDASAIPATRLGGLAGEFPQRSMVASLCQPDFEQAMRDLGTRVSDVLYPPPPHPPPPHPPGPDAAPGDITDAGGGGAIDGRGGCGCSARAGDHAGSLLLGLALFALLYRRRRA